MDDLAASITPEMIRAGERTLENFREAYLDDDLVRAIYIAMEAARAGSASPDRHVSMPARQDVASASMADARLNGGDGNGTSGGMSDDWKEGVGRQLGQLHGDIRAMLNRGLAAIVGLAALIAG